MTDDTTEPNEILATVAAAKAHESAATGKGEEQARARRWQLGKTWLGVGIGSAAVAAAVLFANSRGENKK